jgi:anti-sigma regulatory factor (Ser/Thr protein kinase)
MATEFKVCGADLAELRLRPDATSPRAARRFAVEAAHHWQMIVDEAALEVVTSELVTNAVVHARTPITVRLRPVAGYLEVEVDDEGPGMSDARTPSTSGGQGLRLVHALTAAAGITSLNGGMRAWCRLAVRNA